MEAVLDRRLTGEDVPPFSYTVIAQTFKNSPFNEYPHSMARLRWFTTGFEAVRGEVAPEIADLGARLLGTAERNDHFTFLDVSDAAQVDATLDAIFRLLTGGLERDAQEPGRHEPGIGRWVNEDEFNERHWLDLTDGADRQNLHDRVLERLREAATEATILDEIYLYPPEYGDEPDGMVRHSFRIFGHLETGDPASSAAASERLGRAVESVLREIRDETG